MPDNDALSLISCYERYGGFMQPHPITDDEKLYDDTCREVDRLEQEIGKRSAALFTAAELIWFSGFVSKVFFGLKQDQLDRQRDALEKFLEKLDARRSTT